MRSGGSGANRSTQFYEPHPTCSGTVLGGLVSNAGMRGDIALGWMAGEGSGGAGRTEIRGGIGAGSGALNGGPGRPEFFDDVRLRLSEGAGLLIIHPSPQNWLIRILNVIN